MFGSKNLESLQESSDGASTLSSDTEEEAVSQSARQQSRQSESKKKSLKEELIKKLDRQLDRKAKSQTEPIEKLYLDKDANVQYLKGLIEEFEREREVARSKKEELAGGRKVSKKPNKEQDIEEETNEYLKLIRRMQEEQKRLQSAPEKEGKAAKDINSLSNEEMANVIEEMLNEVEDKLASENFGVQMRPPPKTLEQTVSVLKEADERYEKNKQYLFGYTSRQEA